MHINHQHASHIWNISMFPFSDTILLECMKIKYLKNDPFVSKKKKRAFFINSMTMLVSKTQIDEKNWFSISLLRSSIILET